ncbi:MAG: hypothetical protein CSB24_05395 [Deltaproteobacteria bacterium]|nr:MAG: hypothetical protein CSB24_05395 [Deltaproteobacteria bacterium]
MRILIIQIIVAVLCQFWAASGHAAEDKRVVRVGWFKSSSLHYTDENGKHSGYDYEFLIALAQYTNWELEFVKGTWAECYEWLKNGEIDLLGIVNKSPQREQIFDFAYTSSGVEFCNLYVKADDKAVHYQSFNQFDGMSIGVEEGTYQGRLLRKYADDNNFFYVEARYPNVEEVQAALKRGEVDAILSSSSDVLDGYSCIAQFSPSPFYYAVTKGNTELLGELDQALQEISLYHPNFISELYSKYFVRHLSETINFTEEEKAFIKSNKEVYILYDPGWFPVEYVDDKTGRYTGIVPEIIERIKKRSGLNLVGVTGKNSTEILKTLRTKSGNYVTSISHDFMWAEENRVNITQPFSSCNIIIASAAGDNNLKTVALVEMDYITKKVKKHFPHLKPVYFQSVTECLKALASGQADCVFLNTYQAEYYMRLPEYKKFAFNTTDAFQQKLCFGVAKTADPLIFSIISKSLRNLSKGHVQNIVSQNINQKMTFSIGYFARMYPLIFLAVILTPILIILLITFFFVRRKIELTKQLRIENNRYNQLAKMSGEHIFEYSYWHDKFTMTNRPDDFFIDQDIVENFSQYVSEQPDDSGGYYLYQLLAPAVEMDEQILVSGEDESRWYNVKTIIIKDDEGGPLYSIGKIQNIDLEMQERAALIDEASKDGMTSLLNQKNFKMRVMESISRGGVLILVDIDDFKFINDTFGHSAGDNAIIRVGEVITGTCRRTDIAGRIGGDEFALFISGRIDENSLAAICKRLNQGANDIIFENPETQISVSIGCAVATGKEKYDELFEMADRALYKVKNNNKNSFWVERQS